jgi:hypothetical protein
VPSSFASDPVLAVVAPAGDDPRLVVVVPVQRVPAVFPEPLLPAPERALEVAQVERVEVPLALALVEVDVLELEDHVELVAGRVGEQPRLLERHARHLADVEQRVASEEHLAVHLLQELVDPRPADVVLAAEAEPPVARRAVGQLRVLGDEVDDVHAEAVDTAVQPPVHHRVDRRPESGFSQLRSGCLRENRCR